MPLISKTWLQEKPLATQSASASCIVLFIHGLDSLPSLSNPLLFNNNTNQTNSIRNNHPLNYSRNNQPQQLPLTRTPFRIPNSKQCLPTNPPPQLRNPPNPLLNPPTPLNLLPLPSSSPPKVKVLSLRSIAS